MSDPAQAERFRRIILPHLDGAYGLARFLSRDATAAEDIVQEAFLRAYRGFSGFRGAHPRAWLFAIVRNCVFDWQRADSGRGETVSDGLRSDRGVLPLDQIADPDDTPEAALVRRGEIETVRAVIEQIPEPFREALVLRELEDLSYREIAEATGAPIGTVMSRLARARQMLCAALEISAPAAEEARR